MEAITPGKVGHDLRPSHDPLASSARSASANSPFEAIRLSPICLLSAVQ